MCTIFKPFNCLYIISAALKAFYYSCFNIIGLISCFLWRFQNLHFEHNEIIADCVTTGKM